MNNLDKALLAWSNATSLEKYSEFIKSDTASERTNLIDNNFMAVGSATMLLPFKDGVFDLTTDTFRPTERSDYLSMCLNYDYPIYLKQEFKDVDGVKTKTGFGPEF